jgi:CRISPR-associated protein Cas1
MIKRTIEISSAPAYLVTRYNQLLLKRDGETTASIPCEDLGMVIVDHPGTTYSHSALASIVASDAALVICGRDHLPLGILLPLSDHSQVVWRVKDQIAVPRPLRKRLWKQIIQAKILAQAENLPREDATRRKLCHWARVVRSGDPDNLEAQAAKAYWSAWLFAMPDDRPSTSPEPFRRNQDGEGVNALLNYGYAIFRAAVSRCLIAAGLLPALGLHHSNRSNAFCLADDLLEPLRPIVDERVRELHWAGHTEVDRHAKEGLLELLTREVRTGDVTGPLLVGLHRYASSLVNCYQGTAPALEIPVRC